MVAPKPTTNNGMKYIIIVIILLVACFVVFFLSKKSETHKMQITTSPTPEISRASVGDAADIENLVKDFYKKWLENPDPTITTDTLMREGYITQNAATELHEKRAYDLPTCSQNPLAAGDYKYSSPKINGSLASMDITGYYSSATPPDHTITLSLVQSETKWLIDTFHCP